VANLAEMRLWQYLHDVYFKQSALSSDESRADYAIQIGQFCVWWFERCQQAEGPFADSPRRWIPPRICDLSRVTICECRAWKAAKRSVSTANHLKRVLTAVCNHAAEAGLIPFPGRIRDLKEPQREPRAWRLGELARIIATAAELTGKHGHVPLADLMPAFYRFAYDTALRIGSLLATRWTWLSLGDFEASIPASFTKDKQEIAVQLSRATVDALVQLQVYRLSGRSDDDRVFGDWREHTFRRLHKRIVYAALIDPHCDVNSLRGKRLLMAERSIDRWNCFHKIRRTTATEITAVAGEDVACKALGHSSLQVTRRYLDKRRLKQTVQASQRPEIPVLPPLRVLAVED
jgi:integrase